MASAGSLDWPLRPNPVTRRYSTKITTRAPAQNHQRRLMALSWVVRPSAWVKRALAGRRSASVMEVSEFIASSQSLSPHHHIDDPGAGMISTGAKRGFRGHKRPRTG